MLRQKQVVGLLVVIHHENFKELAFLSSVYTFQFIEFNIELKEKLKHVNRTVKAILTVKNWIS